MGARRQVRNGNVEITVEAAGPKLLTCGSTNYSPVVPRFNTRDKKKLTTRFLYCSMTGPTVPSMTNGVLRFASGGGECTENSAQKGYHVEGSILSGTTVIVLGSKLS